MSGLVLGGLAGRTEAERSEAGGRPARSVLRRGPVAKAAVGSVDVVADAPIFHEEASFCQGGEDLEVEQFVRELAIEALDVGVLPRRSWI